MNTPCIEFTGAVSSSGYGQRRRDGRHGRQFLVHRLAWEEAHGPIPDGLCVLHNCDNRRCVNVDHLFLGTHKENAIDRENKGRGVYLRGEQSASTKYPDALLAEIRAIYATGHVSQAELCRRYGMSPAQMCRVVNNMVRPLAEADEAKAAS